MGKLNDQLKITMEKLKENDNQKEHQTTIKKLNKDLEVALNRKSHYKEKSLEGEETLKNTKKVKKEKELALKTIEEENNKLKTEYNKLYENYNYTRDELAEVKQTVTEQKENFDRLLDIGKREASVNNETLERTITENKHEIDKLKREIEKKKTEVQKGLKENNNERKLKATITLETKETQIEHNQLKIKHKELKDTLQMKEKKLETKKKALQDAQDHYQVITMDESKLREQATNKDIRIKELEAEISRMKNENNLTEKKRKFNKDDTTA